MRQPLLSDAQWKKVEPLLPKLKRHRRGRPPKDNRVVPEGILWVLKTGARWCNIPGDTEVSGTVCWKRLHAWDQQGVWPAYLAFLEELQVLAIDPKVELWFGDECGVEGDPRPRRRWVQPGPPRTVPYLDDHIRQNVIGFVSPQTGDIFSLIVDGVDTDVFQFFLDEMAKAIPPKEGVRQLLILDNASWHKTRRLNWHHFEPKFLPGHSPDFNPIERLWLRLKTRWF